MTIAERIQKILDTEKLSPSRFAEEIGVQRSSLSHILSGRNNPGYDYLIKILTRFSKLDANWLMTGNGEMYVSEIKNTNKEAKPDKSAVSESGFTLESVVRSEDRAEYVTAKKELNETHKIREVNLTVNQKDIVKIIEYYSDNTFAVFYPSEI
jgi:transcriptional regulator with XRE-family HTH domain